MRTAHYRHTQIGWITAGALGFATVLCVLVLRHAGQEWLLTGVTGLNLLLIALFATLTVEVDSRFLRFHFGIGLIRKRIEMADIRHYAVVKNPWHCGWGIHGCPGGGLLYNVSGFWAVEVTLKSGKRLRIGTDEPEALSRAIAVVVGEPVPLTPEEIGRGKRFSWKMTVVTIAIAAAVGALIYGFGYLESRPPSVMVDAETFKVRSLVYGEQFAIRDITEVSLINCFPRIQMRTNGYSAGGTLRGHFRLDKLGNGQLFIEWAHPPFVLVKRDADYVIVNFRNPERTRQLYRELLEHWGGKKAD